MASARKKKQNPFEVIAEMENQGVLKDIDGAGHTGNAATAPSDSPPTPVSSPPTVVADAAPATSEQSHHPLPASEATATPQPAQETDQPPAPALRSVPSPPTVVADAAPATSEQSHHPLPASEATATPQPAQETDQPPAPEPVAAQHEQAVLNRSTAVSVPSLNYDAIEAIAQGNRPVISSPLPYSPATANGANLPGGLRALMQDRPVYYTLLGESFAASIQARTARVKHKKKSLRIYEDLAHALTMQSIRDKRQLDLKGLAVSHYVDAALTVGRGAETTDQLVTLAHQERDNRIADASENLPNHYTLSPTNAAWLDEVTDDMTALGSKGMQAYLVNALVRHFLANLSNEGARAPR
ncbi:hypothetical protein OG948_60570 (plasmid) [Embleya sp. NBC_00888]|uniref:hypothetical protein n=1 Tax=Embleya sp. NBC_00888 TaxID=2975960 RepID=UPI002F9130A6|nr:hypothetical protein OG948_60570 [Embleya sp. NBC_00888]